MIENQAMQMVLKLETKSLLQMAEKSPNLTMTST
jgi:hypothetical protein